MIERRAVFVTIPPLLSEIITEVAREEVHLKLIAQFNERNALAEQLPALAPDLVLVGLRAGETDDIGAFVLKLIPAAKVIVLSNDRHDAYLHEMRTQRTVLKNFSLTSLLTALVGSESSSRG